MADSASINSSDNITKGLTKAEHFVQNVIKNCQNDSGFRANLKRADNSATEYFSWEILTRFGVDLEKEWERLAFCLIGSSLAKAKININGNIPLGKAIAQCTKGGSNANQGDARLRRLLACTSTQEACLVLRPILSLIVNNGISLDFSQLLQQLLWFTGEGRERVRTRWAMDFYRNEKLRELS